MLDPMLKLFRRHLSECQKELAEKNLTDAAIRSWEHCHCPVHYSGTWDGRTYPRTSLKVNDWKRAEKELKALMRGDRQSEGVTLADALERWRRDCQLPPAISASTLGEHDAVARWMLAFAREHRITLLSDFDLDAINEWRARWGVADSTHRSRLGYVAAFFNYCSKRQLWLDRNPIDRLKKPPMVSPSQEETQPIDADGTEDNWHAILAAMAEPVPSRRTKHGKIRECSNPLVVNPQVRLLLAQLMYHGGTRVSDALALDTRKLRDHSDCASYEYMPIKRRVKRNPVTTFMPLWLARGLRGLPAGKLPHQPFSHGCKWQSMARMFDMELKRVGEAIGQDGLRSHRLRNSFAVNALNRGVELADVSKWLGHKSIKTTELYYAPWVPSRVSRSRAIYVKSHEMSEQDVAFLAEMKIKG